MGVFIGIIRLEKFLGFLLRIEIPTILLSGPGRRLLGRSWLGFKRAELFSKRER